jgi:hypothetical protein
MTSWEYTHPYWEWRAPATKWDAGTDPMAPALPRMSSLGEAGWELVTVTTAQDLLGGNLHVYFTASFKRPKTASSDT